MGAVALSDVVVLHARTSGEIVNILGCCPRRPPILLALCAVLLTVVAQAGAAMAQGASVEAAVKSRLTGTTLPPGVMRVLDRVIVANAVKEIKNQAGQRGKRVLNSEMLIWTGEAYKPDQAKDIPARWWSSSRKPTIRLRTCLGRRQTRVARSIEGSLKREPTSGQTRVARINLC
jgi:hypothetical protein